ncbi:YL1-domain-containing protein [Backusella circina FSU 941]|nr:YL1-domain-containing protein [Backusella circina FSU 941]
MSFVQERERRANAGSRMKALLDEQMDMEVLFDYNENEVDEAFSEKEDEEMDVLDSDFDLDSSEGEQEEIEEGQKMDKQLQREERQTHKTFIPPPSSTKTPNKPTIPKLGRKRKPKAHESHENVRYSSRKSTVLNRVLVEEQRKEDELRRAAQPKRKRLAQTKLTQEELLAEAAITEEKNRDSLLEWQQKEQLRKDNARKREKKAIEGPFIRYHSFADGDLQKRPKVRRLIMIKSDDDKKENTSTEITDKETLEWHKQKDYDDCDLMGRTCISFINYQQQQEDKMETKDLSDKELEQLDLIEQFKPWLKRSPKPNAPTLCPITGQVARYRDPQTGVPFFNKEAYRAIRSCLNNEQAWSSCMGMFVGDVPSASGVPKGWY